MGKYASLRDVLGEIAAGVEPVVLRSLDRDWDAAELLQSLPERRLERRVQFMPGFYIAAVSESGCLGEVLFRIRKKNAQGGRR
ncbi:MAG TPA: hypothetical protein P5119_07475 [Candidatus Aminicenantes bacterium]|nr:hypothetical protein [Candidatus Aminicenantes bacterium]HRY65168.1 hypothetical protein [Candidatus Aminicenantes bacterium]HRZ72364.1 hypothetical protein [Candidatus Aminicenantes bacterium]